jgi:hypothetical protein
MLHENITVGDVHYIQNWSVADTTARDALVVAAADVGKVCQVTGTATFYILTDDSPMTWSSLASGGGTVTSVTSANADATVATTTTTPVITIVQAPALRSATTTVSVSAATAPTSGQVLTATSGTAATWQTPSSGITLGTPQASTSGTSIDFTGIPAGTKVINVMFNGMSTSGTSNPIIQIGDAGGFETTGYLGAASTLTSTSQITTNYTTGFGVVGNWSAASVAQGAITLTLLSTSTNTWISQSASGRSDSGVTFHGGGSKSLSAELTQVRITTVGGTDTFDAGEINISYI